MFQNHANIKKEQFCNGRSGSKGFPNLRKSENTFNSSIAVFVSIVLKEEIIT